MLRNTDLYQGFSNCSVQPRHPARSPGGCWVTSGFPTLATGRGGVLWVQVDGVWGQDKAMNAWILPFVSHPVQEVPTEDDAQERPWLGEGSKVVMLASIPAEGKAANQLSQAFSFLR